jgi:F-type H+-transporting ATPase subunit delta
MSDEKLDGYAAAMFDVASAEGVLGRVSDEIFRFSRIVEANPDLRSALTDPASPGEAKARVVEELLGGRVHPVSVRLLVLVVDAGLARDLSRVVDAFTARVSAAGGAAIAEVRVAAPIDEDLRNRLAEALSRSKGRQVDVKVIVDPSVIGGVVTTIGDEVIDGSVRRRLEQLRASLAG